MEPLARAASGAPGTAHAGMVDATAGSVKNVPWNDQVVLLLHLSAQGGPGQAKSAALFLERFQFRAQPGV